MNHRQLPPFAKDFACHRHRGGTPVVFAGPRAWDWARHDQRRKLVMPPDRSPADFRWPVAGLEIVVLDTGANDDLLMHLAHALLLAGALKVAVIPHIVPRIGGLAVFAKEVSRAA